MPFDLAALKGSAIGNIPNWALVAVGGGLFAYMLYRGGGKKSSKDDGIIAYPYPEPQILSNPDPMPDTVNPVVISIPELPIIPHFPAPKCQLSITTEEAYDLILLHRADLRGEIDSVFFHEPPWDKVAERARAGDTGARHELVDQWIHSTYGRGALSSFSVKDIACMAGWVPDYPEAKSLDLGP